jgi:hypothetical protein
VASYQATILADNPIHFWRLNEGSGALMSYDWGTSKRPLMTDGYGLVIQGTTNISPALAPLASGFGWRGITADGGGYMCNAAGLIARGPSTGAADPNQPFPTVGSIECWSLNQDFQSAHFVGMWAPQGAVNQKNAGLSRGATSLQGFLFGVSAVMTASAPNDALYHHLVLTWDGTNVTMFVDGAQKTQTAQTAAIATGVNTWFVVGETQPNQLVAQSAGLVSEVAVYGTALSTGQIDTHFNAADELNIFPQWKGNTVPPVAPSSIVSGTNHIGLSGQSQFVVSQLAGVIVSIIAAPPHRQEPGNPTYEWDQGWLSISSAGGMLEEKRLTRNAQVWMPRLVNQATLFSYYLFPGVVVNITELLVT